MVENMAGSQMDVWQEGFESLQGWLLKCRYGLVDTQRDQLKDYCSYLDYISRKINLIADGDREELAIKHVLPALYLGGLLAAVPNARVLDLGSGAGLPGIPLKIVFPDSNFILVESRRRRANFLKDAIRKLGLQRIEVYNERVEALSGRVTEVDVVVSRATKNLVELSGWARQVLKPHGVLIATLDPKKGLGEGAGIMLRRRVEWANVLSWHGAIR